MRVIGYSRVSTEGQAVEGVSLDAQKARIEAWCTMRGFTFNPADLFTDAGLSGKRSDNRPGLQAALEAVCGAGGSLVVYSLSRLARSVRDTLGIAERLGKAGAHLVSLSEQLDTTTASGKMMFRLLSVLAEFERDLISERTTTALSHKRAKGERIGQVPYGKRLDRDGKSLVDDQGERDGLETIRELAAEGLTSRAIARELTRRGYATKAGNGRPWSPTSVRRIVARIESEPRHG